MNMNLLMTLLFSLCGGILVLAMWGVGIYMLAFRQKSKKKAEASQTWPGAAGTILASELKRSVSHDDDGHESVAYYPAVEFEFQAGGQTLHGNRPAFGGVVAQKDPAVAEKVLARYPVGARVTVYYNPQNLKESVLERQAEASKSGLVIGIVCLVMGACIACPILIGLVRNLAPMIGN
jgi:hypothetical protein